MTNHQKLKNQLSERDISQAELAKRTKFGEPRISQLCNKDTNLTEESLKKLAGAIGCKIDDIV